jgi:hydroxymethylpyrimidine/phosphomethylpyrimidine kinase
VTAVLVIAGSDSSGGAGLVRDVRTLTRLDTRVLCAVTAVTAQSDSGVRAVHPMAPELVRAQIAAALATTRIGAIKIGMLATGAVALAVAASLPPRGEVPMVLDPVLLSSSGGVLLDDAGRAALEEMLLPRAEQGRALLARGPAAVLVKGGHGGGREAVDLLLVEGQPVRRLSAPRSARTLRGTGCALASAIAAGLAAGLGLEDACARAKQHLVELFQQPA